MSDFQKPETTKATVTIQKIERLANSEKIGVATYSVPGAPLPQTAKCWFEEASAQLKVGESQEVEFYMKEPSNPKYPAEAWIWTEYAKKGSYGKGGRSWQPKSLAERYEQAAISALGCATAFAKDSVADFPEVLEWAKQGFEFIKGCGELAPKEAPAASVSRETPQAAPARTPEQAWYDARQGSEARLALTTLCRENKWALDAVIRRAIEHGVDTEDELWGFIGTLSQRAEKTKPATHADAQAILGAGPSVKAGGDEYDPFAED